MSTQKISIPGLVYGKSPVLVSPGASATLGTTLEIAISAVPIAMGAAGAVAATAAFICTATFNAAHGIIASTIGGQLYITMPSQTVPSPFFQFTGVTGVTAWNGVTLQILSVPTTTTITFYATISTTGAVFTAASLVPVYTLPFPGDYDFLLGPNAVIQYNPDNTGYPQTNAIATTVTGATFRQLAAVSTAGQLWFDGVGQKIVLCSGGAGTSRFSLVQ